MIQAQMIMQEASDTEIVRAIELLMAEYAWRVDAGLDRISGRIDQIKDRLDIMVNRMGGGNGMSAQLFEDAVESAGED